MNKQNGEETPKKGSLERADECNIQSNSKVLNMLKAITKTFLYFLRAGEDHKSVK